VNKKLQLLSLPVGLGLAALALLALSLGASGAPAANAHAFSFAAVCPLPRSFLATYPAWTATGENNDDLLGWCDEGVCIAGAGDVNGDGYADIIVGAPYHDGGETNRGKVYVHHGSSSGPDATPVFAITGRADRDHLGYAVAGAGDVNGDGHADVLVSALGAPGATYKGQVYLYLGGNGGLNPSPAFTATGQADGDIFGFSAGGAGDVNGDGYADIFVGAPWADDGDTDSGKVHVHHGSPSGPDLNPAFTATGSARNDGLGVWVAGAGDVNGDDYADVLVSAYNGYPGTDRGQVYLYLGSSNGLSPTPAFTITGRADGDHLYPAAGAGDVNSDGFGDVIIGASYADGGGSHRGQAYLYLGGSAGLRPSPALTFTGAADSDHLGYAVAGAGDVNGDGYADLLIGALSADAGGNDRGQVYLYLGSSGGLRPSPALTISGAADHDHLGSAVAGAGDVNGDGYADVLIDAVGAPGGTFKGQVYLYLGGRLEINYLHLPIIVKDSLSAPDLVVDSLVATSQAVTVTLKNQGNAPVTDGFWVDVYVDPEPPPTGVNQHWRDLASQGLVWGVTTRIPANGGTLTLSTNDDTYLYPEYSHFSLPLTPGTPIYVQVDSVNLNTDYGGVLEDHEVRGGAYNNITGTLVAEPGLTGPGGAVIRGRPSAALQGETAGLPPRYR
jgi:hypothetical protein